MTRFTEAETMWPFRTPGNKGFFPGETNSSPSETQPNQAMTIQEIMHRYATNRVAPIGIKNMAFTGEALAENMIDKEQIEIAERIKENEEVLLQKQKEFDELREKRRKQRADAKTEAEIAKGIQAYKEREAKQKRDEEEKAKGNMGDVFSGIENM